MLASIMIGAAIGIGCGVISGLVPGIHANTMAGVLLSLQALLLAWFDPVVIASAMFAALVTHTFLDCVPGTFLGIPDADTSLAVLPAHSLCLEGRGEEAVRISALGSAAGVALSLPLALAFVLVLPALQPGIDWGIGLIILAVAGYLIVVSESPGWALAVFGVSGVLGVFTLHYSFLAWPAGGESGVLMPLLSGLFGIAVLLRASHGSMPAQHFSGIDLPRGAIRRGSILGSIAGALVGWLPGLSNATANALLTSVIGYDTNPREYILATSAANTVNAFLGLAALYAISRTRNGVMAALAAAEEVPPATVILLAGAIAAVGAYLLTIRLSSMAGWFGGVNVTALNYGVIAFVTLLSLFLCGPFGGLVLLLATAVGYVPALVNIRRVYCMGAIMVPVMVYSFGVI
ncbi:tripartite tricarboxylate transporter permease [Methanoculleus sp. 7T]|uniref:tripartite tricarboxylate transporter permease n=1 Tax=Methanoculleus sp. 7T TaxID=2937282 RepID=UPI0020C069B3|nr:tripartite tricarboxylate transporter permease [Methanoculleus sp. 7T]